MSEAQITIETLQAENARLRAALQDIIRLPEVFESSVPLSIAVMMARRALHTTCLQEVLGKWLDRPAYKVPDFDGETWYSDMQEWLISRGWEIECYATDECPAGRVIAKGYTERETYHVVILQDGQLVFDPHPSQAGLSRIDYYYRIVPLS